jgi:hypothetical protein
MLPPLIRDVESPTEKPKHTYYSLTDAQCIRFIVEFDEAYFDANKFPLKKFPLRFRCELCDLEFQAVPLELGEIETRALIRAFFLGVKVQIIANENRLPRNYNLRIQLSSTLFVECGELIDESDELSPEDICNQVSFDLYSKSCDFFGSPQDGLAVWRVRVAQELFGEPKPAPEVFWPQEAEMNARRAMMGDALSPMNSALAVATVAPVLASGSPILAVSPMHVATVRRTSFASGIAASLMIGVTGLTLGCAFWDEISASPKKLTINAQTALADVLPEKAAASGAPHGVALDPATQTLVTPVRFGDSCEASDQLFRATLPLCETPLVIAEAQPAPPREFALAPAKIGASATVGAKSSKPSEALRKKICAAVKTVPSHPSQRKRSIHIAKRIPANPLVVVRRAVKSFAAGFARDLRRIPYQLSSLIAGR